MAYQNDGNGFQNGGNFQNGGGFQRKMFDVNSLNLACAECGTPITELPFQPTIKDDGTYGKLYCRECNRNRMRARGPRPGGNFRPRNNY